MGVEFTVVPSDAPEVMPGHLTVVEISQLNAYRKARTVAKKHPDALVLGADTLVCVEESILGKPVDLAEAKFMLSKLEGRSHRVVTGVCLLHLRGHRQKLFAVSTEVIFRALNSTQISAYLHSINPLDKAGAYAIQEQGDMIVERISGSLSNVVGLPVEKLAEELELWTGSSA